MENLSYEMLDLLKKYGNTRKDLDAALKADHRPQVLCAFSEIRENLVEWLDMEKDHEALQWGSGYGALTGLLAKRCGHVTVMDQRDEDLAVNKERNREWTNIAYQNRAVSEGAYDWIFLCGPEKGMNLEDTIAALSLLLKERGRLVFACENSLGLKFLSGAEHDKEESCFTKGQLEAAFYGAGFSQVQFYYPMPEYRFPLAVYSDRYLPGVGDISGMAVSYDRPRYACIHEEEVWDSLMKEQDFARFSNCFLVVASVKGERQKTIFAKYNRTRKEAFQISTQIKEDENGLFVEKSALKEEGRNHISSFGKKYEQLKAFHPKVGVLKPELSEDGMRARFPFVRGITLAEQLGKAIKGQKAPLEAIEKAMELLFDVPEDQKVPFSSTDMFTEVFGTIPELEDMAFKVSNIDGLFENMMVTEQGVWALDYEWVFDFPIPCGYVKYRNLAYFFYRYQKQMEYASLEEFLKEFGITRELAAVYQNMEAAFQTWVHGNDSQGYLANYSQRVVTLEELKGRDQELLAAKDRILQLQAEVEEKNQQIRKEQEVGRLTNNHVANLEAIIRDLRHEVGELGKLATYLNRHEALIFKVRRKLGAQFNKAFPKGTRKRKLLKYCFHTIKHPIHYGKMYFSEEGRNRIGGDFKIGDAYLQYGRLSFAPVSGEGREGDQGWEGPMVSIIIPVYNQIHYTYACLQSILEHTEDVTYEVIIADDVSTDATAQLDQYVKGVVICRNETNQGFLLNCNNGAKKARGKYLLFLNNDTKVTQGWLSSLVNLIESDASIGMVGSKLVYPDGRLQEAGGIIWSDGSGWNYGRLDDPDKPEYNYVKDVDYISGAAIMLPSALWKELGGFDQRFAPAYYEDTDLAFQVRKAGYRVVYQPLSKVIHFEGVSNGTDVNGGGLKRYQVENQKKFREKWKEELKNQYVNTGNPNPFRARERSKGKKIILVVDHYVPTFDKDAGSKATYLYLKMFLKKGFAVKFLGDNFLHEEPYTTTLQQMGIEVLYGNGYVTGIWDWLKTNGDEISFAYLNRPHIATKYVDFIRDYTKIKVIYFGHDLHFLRLGREYELTGDIEIKRQADYWKSMEMTMMYKADMSYFPSYVEIDVIHSIDASIRAKAISLYVYDTFLEQIQEDFSKRKDLMFIGGFGHAPNIDAMLWFANEIFPLVRKELPEVKFYMAGSKAPDEIKALAAPGSNIIFKGFVSDEELAQMYASSKIAVVPLRYGAGVKGKVLEALYNGAPTITTTIGAEGIPFVNTALEIEDDAAAFAAKIVALYRDDKECQRLSRRTQEYIRAHFSMDAAWKTIEEDFS